MGRRELRVVETLDRGLSFITQIMCITFAEAIGHFLRFSHPSHGPTEDTVVVLVRPEADRLKHLAINSSDYLQRFFWRGDSTYVQVLCVGALTKGASHLNQRMVLLDHPVKKLLNSRMFSRLSTTLFQAACAFRAATILRQAGIRRVEIEGPYDPFPSRVVLALLRNSVDFNYRLYGDYPTVVAVQNLSSASTGRTPQRDRWQLSLHKQILRRSSKVTGMSPYITHGALCQGAPLPRLFSSRILVDKASISTAETHQVNGLFQEGSLDFVIWSRLSEEKLVQPALEAVMEVVRVRPETTCLVIGDGPLRDRLESQVAQFRPSFRFVGYLPRHRCLELTVEAKIALCPYSGSSLLEACLLGKAIIAFDIEWHHELIVSGYSGYLVDFRDRRLFVTSALRLIESSEHRYFLGTNARSIAEEVFDEDRRKEKENFLNTLWTHQSGLTQGG